MRKPAPRLEWEFAENEADWQRRCALRLPDMTPAISRRRPLNRFLWGVAGLLLLVSGGDWWWRSTQGQAHQAAATATAQRARATVVSGPDSWVARDMSSQSDMDWRYQFALQVSGLRAAVQATAPTTHLSVAQYTINGQGDQAVVGVVSPSERSASAYRQTRFYRRMPSGNWVQVAPEAALWGPERSLVTPYFVYRLRQHDALAVAAVAPQLDALYTTLRRNFGLPIPFGAEKLVIDVSVTQSPGQVSRSFGTSNHLSVPSPALYLAPVELTDAELLEQSIAFPLLAYVLAQASEPDAIGAAWQPMVSSLYLWQVWDLDLPLSAWRADVVQWLYRDLPASRLGQAVMLPKRYTALCAAHKLWLSSPTKIGIPLLCAKRAWEDWFLAPWRGTHDPPRRLAQLVVPVRAKDYMMYPPALDGVNQPGQAVALATLIEYAVAIYGRERLPVLVAGLGQYKSWDTLLPAVYGVSATDFETGWQAYLAAYYGVSHAQVDVAK